MKLTHTLYALMLGWLLAGCTKNSTRLAGEIIDSKNKTPIENAKVVVNNRAPVFTDENGEFFIEDFDLDKYIVDSITFNVRANGEYQSEIHRDIIGNKQQDIFIIELDPVNDLVYTTQLLSLSANQTVTTINVGNKGLDSIDCIVSASCNWVLYGKSEIVIPPTGGLNLNIQVLTSSIQCRDSCWLYFQWGSSEKDSVKIIKEVPDTVKAYASFSISNQTPNQFQQFECDASSSTDNCSSVLRFRWSFDNGVNWTSQTTEPKVQYSYTTTGNQVITLEVSDEQGNISFFSQSLTVLLAPTPPQLDPFISLFNGDLLCVEASANLLFAGQTFNGLLDHGFVWSSSIQEPTIGNTPGGGEDHKGPFNGISGNFTSNICNLQPQTYYIRAFAKNGFDIVYSNAQIIVLEIIDYVLVSQGTTQMNFVMGNNSAGFQDAAPQHNVILTPFKISKTEVTNAQFAAFLNSGVPLSQISSYIDLPNTQIVANGGIWKAVPGRENYPIVTVSWQGAQDFCTWAKGRLPTEAEWECAAKGGTSAFSSYTLYSGSNLLDNYGWYNGNSNSVKEVMTTLQGNSLDLFDLSGNVREWCADWYDPNAYTPATTTDPQGPLTSPTGEKVLRGGSFALSELPARVYFRDKKTPSAKLTDIGFRIIKN